MLLSHKLNSDLGLGRDVERLLDKLPLLPYQKGDEIKITDAGIWQVYRGVVQLSRVQLDGTEVILGWVTSNGVFDHGLDISAVSYRAIALDDVYVRRYNLQDVARYPLLGRQFLTQLSDRLIKSQHLLAILTFRKIEDRLRSLLTLLKLELGQPVDGGVRLQTRFTHQHLAEAVQTTRVTITRTLGDFQNQGLISIDQEKHIIIKNH